jgi:phage tail-like protein
MATNSSSLAERLYPLPAFYFKVIVTGLNGSDTSFQEVRGIGSEIETEDVVEGGENRFVHRLPKGVKHPQLELKRGITTMSSPLITWCRSVLDNSFSSPPGSPPIGPKAVVVQLLDEGGNPVRAWSFENAYPVKWEIDDFKSTKNEVAIETIVLSYTFSKLTSKSK